MLKTRLVLTLTFISAVITWIAQENLGLLSRDWAFVSKPLTTILITAYAWQRGAATPGLRAWVLAGLAFSLAGDVALLWPKGFVFGLLFFISDACLAINKFAGPVPAASLLVLPSYWGAQWCIASWLAPRR